MTLLPFDVPLETELRLRRLAELVTAENQRQNLISPASVADIWSRHIEDSLQLLRFGLPPGLWIDIGSGAGFPGLVVAIVTERQTILVEPRRLRAEFLVRAAQELGCASVEICQGNVQSITAPPPAVISARAVAPLVMLFERAVHLSRPETIWILPKGRSARIELAQAQESWHADARIEPSLTDPEAGVVIASNVRRKAGRR